MIIGIPKEKFLKEKRIAITPLNIKKLIKLGFEVYIENGAGNLSNFEDKDFISEGAKIVKNIKIWDANIIIKIHPLDEKESQLIKKNSILISFIWPYKNTKLLNILALKNITTLAMDTIPRISRAQSLDALSSMNNLSGYRSIIESTYLLGRTLNGQITAAGKILPAKVMVIGAGVAGLSAIGTAKSLGAIVIAFDKRKEVKEQIHSMGAEFLELKNQEDNNDIHEYKTISSKNKLQLEQESFNSIVSTTDIIITSAIIQNKKSPILITKEMIKQMKPGSIIFDLAIENGGNCELTKKNKMIITNNNIKILGYTNLPSKLAPQASQLYGTNIVNLLDLLSRNNFGKININLKDEIIRNMTIIYNSEIIWPAPISSKKKNVEKINNFKNIKKNLTTKKNKGFFINKYFLYILGLFFIYYITKYIPNEVIPHFIIFLLSCIIGYYVVWNVSHKLHTPLMSVTNAISGIIIIGSILQISSDYFTIIIIAFLGILLSSINIFGGLTITQRMLKMFRKN
ncbi:Re/Si-specific NAD(P)(+) transhydrogenase subunit alpha [Enterobacteriaceae endosymbiont of Donacia semicuprea]|uniref:Re/Si-specific NAD(P)(+) transhydrogenase subunit alpha n=1 Tax=Enterobacteriaceae endosymbiont of Donacia semicuprea TaxID=2675783 RepID=UPI00144A1C07|nr:Re/Si-specific NAD(P)(+) transhydrogenase subunit alpha [Enterobacteriaceae endosymbiont of Donacia semicuprea]QJC32766.1 Re/Si-specific NAD(P)(+) transhydrogenase subunit alpha [Enterobacteriaceae endosymbiont of Donacia semicuprea]